MKNMHKIATLGWTGQLEALAQSGFHSIIMNPERFKAAVADIALSTRMSADVALTFSAEGFKCEHTSNDGLFSVASNWNLGPEQRQDNAITLIVPRLGLGVLARHATERSLLTCRPATDDLLIFHEGACDSIRLPMRNAISVVACDSEVHLGTVPANELYKAVAGACTFGVRPRGLKSMSDAASFDAVRIVNGSVTSGSRIAIAQSESRSLKSIDLKLAKSHMANALGIIRRMSGLVQIVAKGANVILRTNTLECSWSTKATWAEHINDSCKQAHTTAIVVDAAPLRFKLDLFVALFDEVVVAFEEGPQLPKLVIKGKTSDACGTITLSCETRDSERPLGERSWQITIDTASLQKAAAAVAGEKTLIENIRDRGIRMSQHEAGEGPVFVFAGIQRNKIESRRPIATRLS